MKDVGDLYCIAYPNSFPAFTSMALQVYFYDTIISHWAGGYGEDVTFFHTGKNKQFQTASGQNAMIYLNNAENTWLAQAIWISTNQ